MGAAKDRLDKAKKQFQDKFGRDPTTKPEDIKAMRELVQALIEEDLKKRESDASRRLRN